MTIHAFIEALEWPNGLGETPCTRQYKECFEHQQLIVAKYSATEGDPGNLNDYSAEDYQKYNELGNALGILQSEGHLGKGFRYDA